MIRTIAFLMLCAAGLRSSAQEAVVTSLRSLVEKINSIPIDSACSNVARNDISAKINKYKANISGANTATIAQAVSGFLFEDSVLISYNYNYKNCEPGAAIRKVIKPADSLLKHIRHTGYPDSFNILKALRYIKNEFSGFVSLTLTAVNDSNMKITAPQITLNATGPSIVPPGNDSTPQEIFILPRHSYLLTVAKPGYAAYSGELAAVRDTALTISLKRQEAAAPIEKITTVTRQGYWWIPAVIALLILFAVIWRAMGAKSKKAKYTGRDALVEPYHANPKSYPETSGSEPGEQIIDKPGKANSLAGATILAGTPEDKTTKYFVAELMMTAGPRKKRMNELNADKDLGEDVCGFIMAGDEALVWLLDGTSDFYCLRDPETRREYFSSRLLAQCIARELKLHFAEKNMEAFNLTMKAILGRVKSAWLKAIHSLPQAEKDLLNRNIKEGNFPECAATVLIARLSLEGRLTVYRSGDSKLLVYNGSGDEKVFLDTILSSKNPDSNDRVFFRLMITEQDEFEILHNEPLFEIVTLEKVQTIMALSDGIGSITEEHLKKEYPKNSDEMRKEIIYQLQGTEDDKALCIIEIKG